MCARIFPKKPQYKLSLFSSPLRSSVHLLFQRSRIHWRTILVRRSNYLHLLQHQPQRQLWRWDVWKREQLRVRVKFGVLIPLNSKSSLDFFDLIWKENTWNCSSRFFGLLQPCGEYDIFLFSSQHRVFEARDGDRLWVLRNPDWFHPNYGKFFLLFIFLAIYKAFWRFIVSCRCIAGIWRYLAHQLPAWLTRRACCLFNHHQPTRPSLNRWIQDTI